KDVIQHNKTNIRIFIIEQDISGGGSTARYGVDRCLATILKMCESDGDWARLQRARIAVSDGDTVYHSGLVADGANILDNNPHLDGVMPFLLYKITACHRFFNNYIPRNPLELTQLWKESGKAAVKFSGQLHVADDLYQFPRNHRSITNIDGDEGMLLRYVSGRHEPRDVYVPFICRLTDGLRFGVISDENQVNTYVFEDGTMTIEPAYVSGSETALLFLENEKLNKNEKWKWHTMVGHDLFLTWAFQRMGLNESLILPDTSDALKMFRAWCFAVGGQHQLSRPDMHRVTGTDYQSGRVLQSFGAQTVLGSSNTYSETEVDRLAKMIRNFANEQSVFYGNTRSRGLERASGLYLHMTAIQDQVEAEVRNYSDDFYEQVAFPERIIFPLRWMLQNFIGFYVRADESGKKSIAANSFSIIFGAQLWNRISDEILSEQNIKDLSAMSFEPFRERSEELAEDILLGYWPELMSFYSKTLSDFFEHHDVEHKHYGWLMDGLEQCRNGMKDERPITDPNQVWSPDSFVIDYQRGQVLNIQKPSQS
ncbi:hypothetical protein, partial [Endozoicomonas acroporae]|uniref:hypothetical protein n=1 Tax=Endozoicomonas acroporae TaxID=1701104 RepID=UPI003D7B707B